MIARRISADDRLILVASRAWIASRKAPEHPRDLARDRIAIRRPRSGAILPWSLARDDEAITMKGGCALVAESALAARDYAIAGLGVALLASSFVESAMRQGALGQILPAWTSPLPGFYLMYPHRGQFPLAMDDLLRGMASSVGSGHRDQDR